MPSDKRGLNYDKYVKKGNVERNTLTEFNSNNTRRLSLEETKQKIASLEYIKEQLAKRIPKNIIRREDSEALTSFIY